MFNTKIVSVVLITSFSMGAWADLGGTLKASANPFQVLKTAFESASHATITDYPNVIDLNTSTAKMKCVQICEGSEGCGDNTVDVLHPSVIGRFDFTVPGTPATPANGPLFPATPGTPDSTVTNLIPPIDVYNEENMALTPKSILATLDGFSVTNSVLPSGELESKAVRTVDGSFMITDYRKNVQNAELLYHNFDNTPFDTYGYCYSTAK